MTALPPHAHQHRPPTPADSEPGPGGRQGPIRQTAMAGGVLGLAVIAGLGAAATLGFWIAALVAGRPDWQWWVPAVIALIYSLSALFVGTLIGGLVGWERYRRARRDPLARVRTLPVGLDRRGVFWALYPLTWRRATAATILAATACGGLLTVWAYIVIIFGLGVGSVLGVALGVTVAPLVAAVACSRAARLTERPGAAVADTRRRIERGTVALGTGAAVVVFTPLVWVGAAYLALGVLPVLCAHVAARWVAAQLVEDWERLVLWHLGRGAQR